MSSYATVMWTLENFPRAQTVACHIAMYYGMHYYILACHHIFISCDRHYIDPGLRLECTFGTSWSASERLASVQVLHAGVSH